MYGPNVKSFSQHEDTQVLVQDEGMDCRAADVHGCSTSSSGQFMLIQVGV